MTQPAKNKDLEIHLQAEPIKVYLACPLSHENPEVERLRVRAVCEAHNKLLKQHPDWSIWNPLANNYQTAMLGGLPGTHEFWVETQDLPWLREADILVVLTLPGWKESTGVTAEIKEAERLGKRVEYFVDQRLVTSETLHALHRATVGHQLGDCLDEAKQTICGERQDQYGNPEDSFAVIAIFWSIYLAAKLKEDISRDDVAMLMILMKVAREMNTPKRDNMVDICRYASISADRLKDTEPVEAIPEAA